MKKFVALIVVSVVLFSCFNNQLVNELSVEKKMEIGNEFFQKEKYHKAIPYYQDIAFERNSNYTSEAQLKLADCYFYQGKYSEARFEYEEMIRLFNEYENIDQAYFKIGVCHFNESLPSQYSQIETKKAINAFEDFIEKFPFDKKKKDALDYIQKCHLKLLEKKYYNGYTYFKMYDYSAALMYFNEIIELGNVNEPDKLSLYYSTKIYISRNNIEKAKETAKELMEKYPGSKQAEKLKKEMKGL